MAKRLLLIGSLVLSLTAAGCGDSTPKHVNPAQLRGIVQRFANAHGASACKLLSDQALINVYGGFKKKPAQARAACVRQSSNFKGQPVKITSMNIIDDSTVRIGATNMKGDVAYVVNVRRFGNTWLIDRINRSKPQ